MNRLSLDALRQSFPLVADGLRHAYIRGRTSADHHSFRSRSAMVEAIGHIVGQPPVSVKLGIPIVVSTGILHERLLEIYQGLFYIHPKQICPGLSPNFLTELYLNVRGNLPSLDQDQLRARNQILRTVLNNMDRFVVAASKEPVRGYSEGIFEMRNGGRIVFRIIGRQLFLNTLLRQDWIPLTSPHHLHLSVMLDGRQRGSDAITTICPSEADVQEIASLQVPELFVFNAAVNLDGLYPDRFTFNLPGRDHPIAWAEATLASEVVGSKTVVTSGKDKTEITIYPIIHCNTSS
ncbi:hypothetical protein HY988_02090 [Candidatus Micrarchaeota archaeon]|nr:hypothetical protein [Candidatus Micrarchaeota archaeon]